MREKCIYAFYIYKNGICLWDDVSWGKSDMRMYKNVANKNKELVKKIKKACLG